MSLSTRADRVGAGAMALRPLHALIEGHVLAPERLHGDDQACRRYASVEPENRLAARTPGKDWEAALSGGRPATFPA